MEEKTFGKTLIETGKTILIVLGIVGLLFLVEGVVLWLCQTYYISYENYPLEVAVTILLMFIVPIIGAWIILSFIQYKETKGEKLVEE